MVSTELNISWLIEQRKREIERLRAILRNPRATSEDIAVATDQLTYWQEIS